MMMNVSSSARTGIRFLLLLLVTLLMTISLVVSSNSSSSNSNSASPLTTTSSPTTSPLQKQQQQEQQQQIPILYRYWGRRNNHHHHHSLTTTTTSLSTTTSIPILIIGPNVDHWKLVGQELAARGYNVMACERVPQQQQQKSLPPENKETTWLWRRNRHKRTNKLRPQMQQQQQEKNRDAAALYILQLLDALKWKQAVLVACDSETAMAMAAALQLATTSPQPKRIAGLILCGAVMPSVQDFLQTYGSFSKQQDQEDETETSNRHFVVNRERSATSLDQYLKEHLTCPFTIVWDGTIPPLVEHLTENNGSGREERDDVSVPKTTTGTRSLILGGGSAPHRRRPELFAWAVTRFVEEQIGMASSRNNNNKRNHNGSEEQDDDETGNSKFAITFHLDQVFSSGSLVVCGRLVATALFYAIVMKSLAFQYENVRWGMIYPIKAKYAWIRSVQKRVYSAMAGLAERLWAASLWRFVKSRNEKEEEDGDEEDKDETFVQKEARGQAEPELESSASEESTSEKDNDGPADGEQKEEQEEEPRPSQPQKPLFLLDQVVA